MKVNQEDKVVLHLRHKHKSHINQANIKFYYVNSLTKTLFIDTATSVAQSFKKKENLDKKCFPHFGEEPHNKNLEDSMTKLVQKRTKPTFSQHEKLNA